MGLGSWLADKVGNTAGELIESVGSTVDRFVNTDEDRRQMEILKQEIAIKMRQFEMDAQEMILQDRQSARAMYMKDSGLQKAFALVFLTGYIIISGAMISLVFGIFGVGNMPELSAFEASIISMVFTAMSTKVNTIVDFLFGGSKSKDDSEERLANAFQGKAEKDGGK